MWKTIELKGSTFNVCDDGRIILKGYVKEYADGRIYTYPDREIKKYKDHGGYEVFTLGRKGKTINYKVGQVVAYAFPEICGEWFEGAQVNHKNEDKTDNRAHNLEWVTQKENNNWGTHNERARKHKLNGYGSKKVAQYDLKGELIKIWPSTKEIERVLGFNHTCISRCMSGDRNAKTAYGFVWKTAA